MTRREFLGLCLLLGCSEEEITMDKKKKLLFSQWLNSGGGASTPWYLAGGIAPSTSYIIYDPLQAASLAASYTNLANPGVNDANPVVAPTLPDGWLFNGLTQYIDANGSFGASKTLIIWCEQFINGTWSAGDSKLNVRPDLNSPPNTRIVLTGNLDLLGPTQSGILGIRAGQVAYRNGKKLTGYNVGAFPAGTDYPVFIGCRNNSGTPTQYGGGKIYRYALYDIVLSDAQMEAVMSAMIADVNPVATAYESVVLASDPLVYFPCNNLKGSFMIDKVANIGAQAAYDGPYAGVAGPTGKGLAMQGGTTDSFSFCPTLDNWPTTVGMNLREFSVSMWIKNINANAQARPCNIYSNSTSEYLALEIRSGNIALYFDESGGIWNTGALAVAPNNTWAHLVAYNSETSGKAGIYLNGVKYEVSRTGTGYTTGVPDNYYPYLIQSMTGAMSHISFYDHALSQAEVNSLL